MDQTSISLDASVPYLILIFVAVIIVAALVAVIRRRRVEPGFHDIDWLPAIFSGMFDFFAGRRSFLDDDGPRKRRGPDMAFSAGRDAAQQNTQLRQTFIMMEPHQEEALRTFYLDDVGLIEMRAPNSHVQQDGFWAVTGTRQTYFGTMPDFKPNFDDLPSFPIQNLQEVAKRLDAAGYQTQWNTNIAHVRRLVVVDPIGNQIALVPSTRTS